MVDWLYFGASLLSALVASGVGIIFIESYIETTRRMRLLWGVAFLSYAVGHFINSWLVLFEIPIDSGIGLTAMWVYVNFGGTGTLGFLLFATITLLKKQHYLRWVVSLSFMAVYSASTALFAFVLPGDTPLAFFNPTIHNNINNMSWLVSILVVPVALFIGVVFLNHYRITGLSWAEWIGLSFIIYTILMFIWPVIELKSLFYILRTVSVFLLGIGGVQLSRE